MCKAEKSIEIKLEKSDSFNEITDIDTQSSVRNLGVRNTTSGENEKENEREIPIYVYETPRKKKAPYEPTTPRKPSFHTEIDKTAIKGKNLKAIFESM